MPGKTDYDSSSSSSSDSEDESGIVATEPDDVKPLSLMDDDSSFLIMPPCNLEEEADSVLGEADSYIEGSVAGTGDQTDSQLDSTQKNKTVAQTENTETDVAKPKKKKKRRKILYICTVNCKYEVIRRVSKRFGFRELGEEEDWNLYWTDYSVALERVMEMKRYQKINHFPGMSEICRKDLLGRNMTRMGKQFPKEYTVFPKTWVLPADYGDFASYARQKKNKTYILKPASGCQGKGIWITKNIKDIKPHEHMVCQQYLSKPFLIDGFKFDFRLYVLVTSCDPFRIFTFKDGLARFCTSKYHDPTNSNTDNVFMHLTNYAINKTSESFVRDDEEGGSKRRISTIDRWWADNGYDVGKIWADIDDVVIKTLIAINEILTHNYRTCFPNHIRGSACFEILGFDIMFDKKLKPYVVEVNHSPSFHTDAKLDKEIKEALIYDTINLINCGAVDKRKCIEEERKRIKERLFNRGPNKKETKEELEIQQAAYLKTLTKYEDENLGNFRRIYPAQGTEKYDKFFNSSGSLFQETAAYKARSEAAKQQREEIRQKQEKLEMMLNKKKREPGPRPESPGGSRRRITRRPTLTNRRIGSQQRPTDLPQPPQAQLQHSLLSTPTSLSTSIDTMRPLDISEEEELERIGSLLQRDNLVRGLGIVEHVYRMLHCTPGTVGSSRPQRNNLPIRLLSQFHHRVNSAYFIEHQLPELQKTSREPNLRDNSNNNNISLCVRKCLRYNHRSSSLTSVDCEHEPCHLESYEPSMLSSQTTHLQAFDPDISSTASLLSFLSQPLSKTMKPSQFITTQRQSKSQAPVQNATNPWQRNRISNNRKFGPDVDTDRKSIVRHALSDTPSANFNRALSGHGPRKTIGVAQTAPMLDNTGSLTTNSYGAKVQPMHSQHLSVISAPAPVVQRPDLQAPNRKLTSLETALRNKTHARRTIKLKTLDQSPNALVYS